MFGILRKGKTTANDIVGYTEALSITSFTSSHGGRSSLVWSTSTSDLLEKGYDNEVVIVLVYAPWRVTMSCRDVKAALISAFSMMDGVLPTACSSSSRANSDCLLMVVSPSNGAGVELFTSEPARGLRLLLGLDLDWLLCPNSDLRSRLLSLLDNASSTCSMPASRSSMRSIFFSLDLLVIQHWMFSAKKAYYSSEMCTLCRWGFCDGAEVVQAVPISEPTLCQDGTWSRQRSSGGKRLTYSTCCFCN